MKKKGFTLIELIAVLVIMAIIALIVTPLVMNIIRKAKTAADKRSIDAYGRSIELAVASYLLDNGTFPTSIEQLTIEYSGDEVICSTTQLNSDSSVYLAGCTVGGRSVDGYTYGKEESVVYAAYSVGDEVTYNNIDYYVIADSGTTESSVKLLKATPITSSEISSYLSSTGVASEVNTEGTYAKMVYYFKGTCNGNDYGGCTTDYEQSDIKYIVDIWKTNYAPQALEAKLITYDDLTDNLGYGIYNGTLGPSVSETTPSWVYSDNYSYWTMSKYNDSVFQVWVVNQYAHTVSGKPVYYRNENVVRPVIILPKSAL